MMEPFGGTAKSSFFICASSLLPVLLYHYGRRNGRKGRHGRRGGGRDGFARLHETPATCALKLFAHPFETSLRRIIHAAL